jgi:hypothetical protein
MPTDYAGDPTAADTPDIAPEPEKVVHVNIPIATEGRTVSSIQQAFKALANNITWLFKPKAKSGAFAGLIMAFRTALGHKRFIIDHLGLPMGRIDSWREDWAAGVDVSGSAGPVDTTGNPIAYDADIVSSLVAAGNALNTAGADSAMVTASAVAAAQLVIAGAALNTAATNIAGLQGHGEWRARTVDSGAGSSEVLFLGPDTAVQPLHRYVKLAAADTAADLAILYRKSSCFFDAGVTPAMEWEAKLSAASTVKSTISMGLVLENGLATGAGGGTDASDFAVFQLAPGATNWTCSRRSAGGAVAATTSAVAATTNWTRFRLEFHGATVADDAAVALRFYIDGTLVQTFTTTIPSSTVKLSPHFGVVTTTAGSGGAVLFVGPVRWGHNLYPSDVA